MECSDYLLLDILLTHSPSVDSCFIYIFGDAGTHIIIQRALGRGRFADVSSRYVHVDLVEQMQVDPCMCELSARGTLRKRLHHIRRRLQRCGQRARDVRERKPGTTGHDEITKPQNVFRTVPLGHVHERINADEKEKTV